MRIELYPLKFENLTRDYYFGGRRIAEFFQRDLPEGVIAETWELSDHASNPGVVQNGPLAGRTLHSLMEEMGSDLMGKKIARTHSLRFPLLLKFLDVHQYVLLQVHPNDEFCARHGYEDSGKAEAWHIVWAEPEAIIYWGTQPGVSQTDLSVAIDEDRLLDLLRPLPVKPGDTVYIPPGQVHAIGAGVLLFEVQQNSDVTIIPEFLFLHGAVVEETRNGPAKQMFLEQLRIEDLPRGEEKIHPLIVPQEANERCYLVACSHFALEEWRIQTPWDEPSHPDKFVAFTVIEGRGKIEYDSGQEGYCAGRTLLIPAQMGAYQIVPELPSRLLRSYVPDLMTDVIEPLRQAGCSNASIAALGGWGATNDLSPLLR